MANFQDRPPLAEMAKRTGEAGAGLAAAAHAVGLKNFVVQSADARQRVADSHALRHKLLGGEPGKTEDMGNIIVTGDLYGDAAVKAIQAASTPAPAPVTPQPTPPPQDKTTWQKAWPLILTAVLAAGGGSGLPWLVKWFSQPAATGTDTVTDVSVKAWKPTP